MPAPGERRLLIFSKSIEPRHRRPIGDVPPILHSMDYKVGGQKHVAQYVSLS